MDIPNNLFILYVRTHKTMSKFPGSTSYAPGVSISAANKKKKPRRKEISGGRVKYVRTNKAGRKVVRVRSASGELLKIRKGATDTKQKSVKTFSAGGRYVKRVAKGTGRNRRAFTYKGRLAGKYRSPEGKINKGKGVKTRSSVGVGGNRVSKKFETKKVGKLYVPVKTKFPRNKNRGKK